MENGSLKRNSSSYMYSTHLLHGHIRKKKPDLDFFNSWNFSRHLFSCFSFLYHAPFPRRRRRYFFRDPSAAANLNLLSSLYSTKSNKLSLYYHRGPFWILSLPIITRNVLCHIRRVASIKHLT